MPKTKTADSNELYDAAKALYTEGYWRLDTPFEQSEEDFAREELLWANLRDAMINIEQK